jgi:hypothetical protein
MGRGLQLLRKNADILGTPCSGRVAPRSEKRSGTSTANRAELRTVLDFLRKGDVLIVTRIDRLARSIEDTAFTGVVSISTTLGRYFVKGDLSLTSIAGIGVGALQDIVRTNRAGQGRFAEPPAADDPVARMQPSRTAAKA